MYYEQRQIPRFQTTNSKGQTSLKIKLLQETAITPQQDSAQQGTTPIDDALFFQNYQCNFDQRSDVMPNESSSYEKMTQEIKTLESDVKYYKQKYNEEKNLRSASDSQVIALEKEIARIEEELQQKCEKNQIQENQIRNLLQNIESILRTYERSRPQFNTREVKVYFKKVYERDLQRICYELKKLTQSHDEHLAKFSRYQSQSIKTQENDQINRKNFDSQIQISQQLNRNTYNDREIQNSRNMNNNFMKDFLILKTSEDKISKNDQVFSEKREIKNNQKGMIKPYMNVQEVQDQGNQMQQYLIPVVKEGIDRITKTNLQDIQFNSPDAHQQQQNVATQIICQPLSQKYQFDDLPGIRVVSIKYKVRRLVISKKAFEAKIEDLNSLSPRQDFQLINESQWDCIRTEQPFQKTKTRQLFLMKNIILPTELYVIKLPIDQRFQSLDDAIIQSRSQLIAQYLMEQFQTELQETSQRTNQKVQIPFAKYSDILLLQEMKNNDDFLIGKNQYQIAERYFFGDSIKYNNNDGFILDDDSKLNHLAQAFTFYTFYATNFTCMICNIQRVGNYFTGPAVVTLKGDFDENDMGEDGQKRFICSYQFKRYLGKQFLDLLEME